MATVLLLSGPLSGLQVEHDLSPEKLPNNYRGATVLNVPNPDPIPDYHDYDTFCYKKVRYYMDAAGTIKGAIYVWAGAE